MDEEMMTTAQVAKLLNVCTHTITNYAKDKKIPGAFKLDRQWRFHKSTIQKWIAEKINKRQGETDNA